MATERYARRAPPASGGVRTRVYAPARTSDLLRPEVAEHLRVLVLGVGGADRQQLDAFRAGLDAAGGRPRHAHGVPLRELDDLVLELHPPAARDHDVDLLLL